jgi:hypothetical protein
MPQLSLFASPSALPEGFSYQDDFLSPAEEQTLVRWFRELPFREFEFRGYRSASSRSGGGTTSIRASWWKQETCRLTFCRFGTGLQHSPAWL